MKTNHHKYIDKTYLWASVAALMLSSCSTLKQTLPQRQALQFHTKIYDEQRLAGNTSDNVLESIEQAILNEERRRLEAAETLEKTRLTQIKEWADDWIGIRYRSGGRSRKGVDCSGFALPLYKGVFGMTLQPSSRTQFENDCYKPIRVKDELRIGDLLFFVTNGRRKTEKNINHVAVYTGDGTFVHSTTHAGVIYSRMDEEYWARTFVIGGRVLSEQ